MQQSEEPTTGGVAIAGTSDEAEDLAVRPKALVLAVSLFLSFMMNCTNSCCTMKLL